MALSDLQVFSQYAYDASTEILKQQINLFNEASRGTLILSTKANQGDYSDEAFWKKVTGLVRRRNAYGAGAVTSVTLEHLLDTSVKVAAGTPPVEIPPSQMKWIQRNPEEQGAILGKQLAIDMLADMVNTGLTVCRTALSQEAEVVYDGTGATNPKMNPKQLNSGTRLFGDQAQNIVMWMMHSTPLFDFYDNAIDNSSNLFKYGTINVIEDPFGRAFIISDAPGLITAGVPDTYHTMGLTAGSVVVEQNDDFTDNLATTNGDENIQRTYQAEWSYNMGVKGFAWDKTNGGKSPNDAALAVATNWDRHSTSHKDLAGVIVDTE